jgi:MscS family membrane protein
MAAHPRDAPARAIALAAFGLFVLAAGAARALPPQLPAPSPTPTPAEEAAMDPYGRETPYGCFYGFLHAVERGSYANAAEYLQLPASMRTQREEVVREFQATLDHRFISTTLESISRSARGTVDDALPPNTEKVGEILGKDGRIDVLLVRKESPGSPAVWLFSWETIRQGLRLYQQLGIKDFEERLPAFLVHTHVGSLALWQVAAFILLLPVLFGVSWLLLGVIFSLIRLARHKRVAGEWQSRARSPGTLLLTLLLHRVAVFWIGIPILYRIYYNRVLYILLLAAFLWLLLRIVDAVDRYLLRRLLPAAGGTAGRLSLSFGRRALRGVAFLFVLLLALPVFGVNVTATLAGLGIGGLVVAFAAQKSLENVFAGFAMLADKPLTVGDTCRIGGQLGEIEDVTLWATRLRTNERAVVSIPNGVVMAGQIENLTRRDKFWFHPTVGLGYETTPDQMRQVLQSIRELMVADPRVETEGSRARFVRLGASSLDIDVYAYVRAESYAEFLGIQEELLLRLLDIVEKAGTSVAFPTQTLYVKPPGGAPLPPVPKDRSSA